MSGMLQRLFSKEDRVRRASSDAVNRLIDKGMTERVHRLSTAPEHEVSERIEALGREWDIERFLEMNASALALTGVGLVAAFNKRWLVLPAVVLAFLLQHALQGWCPPVPLFRRFGVRTRQEIDQERLALRLVRGDFRGASESAGDPKAGAEAALAAAKRTKEPY